MSETNPWDAALHLEVVRGNHLHDPEALEPGVKFFVLELEKRGCKTVWSCEGHPYGFNVIFRAPLAIARAVLSCGTFDLAIEEPLVANGWGYAISLAGRENRAAYWEGHKPWDDDQRVRCLREAAVKWRDYLDGCILDQRVLLTPAAKAERYALALCDACTDPSGCRRAMWCAVEVYEELNNEDTLATDGPDHGA